MKFCYAHFLKISSPHHVLDRRYGCFVGDRYCFPIHFLYNCIKSRMTLISVWLMLGTSYSHHSIILVRGMLSDFFVKIPDNDVTWRHFRFCCLKSADVSTKNGTMDVSFLFGKIALYNTSTTRGQPILHDKWFGNYRISSFVGFLMTSSWEMLTSAKINDFKGVNIMAMVLWYDNLSPCTRSPP